MYRCSVCDKVSRPRHNRLMHTVYRTATVGYYRNDEGDLKPVTERQIAQELPVCTTCHYSLTEGVTLEQLRTVYRLPTTPVKTIPIEQEEDEGPLLSKPVVIGSLFD